jgi:hypothetical protein
MDKAIDRLKGKILRGLRSLSYTDAFAEWLRNEKANDGDVVIFNNSFIYRKPLVKTSKNNQYLCAQVKRGKLDLTDVSVIEPGEMNSDFKLLSQKRDGLPPRKPLEKALQREQKELGRLVFVLIGELRDVGATVPMPHGHVKSLRFDPSASQAAVQGPNGNKALIVNRLTDPESVWNAVRPILERELGHDLAGLEERFADAFENLRNEACLHLVLPAAGAAKTATSFIARLRVSVSQQRKLYEAALEQHEKGGRLADGNLRDAMRVAYNFADDAIKVLLLLVSVSDLKAILLWCTLKEHFEVAEAFRKLPWTKSSKKPSLERYRETISGARNRAFHNLLAFDRTIEADLSGVHVNARRLTLFPAYSRRKNVVAFDYEDREMVELLTELTRAPEVTVPLDFWKKNAVVMESFEKLLAGTEETLWALNQARG